MEKFKIIARYEGRLLTRSLAYKVVTWISFLVVLALHFILQSNFVFEPYWALVGLPCAMPFLCAYFLNYAQVFCVVFGTGNFWYNDCKLDTTGVLLARPEENGEYVWGKLFGTFVRMLKFDGLVIVFVMVIHIFASPAPFHVYYYVFYLLTLVFPSLVFGLGVTFLVKGWVRTPGIAMMFLIGIFSILIYFSGMEYWLVDFMGHNVPNVFSEVTGNGEQGFFLMQRGYILVAGLSLWVFSVCNIKRLPNVRDYGRQVFVAGSIFGIAAGMFALIIINTVYETDRVRDYYVDCQNKNVKTPNIRIVNHEIELARDGELVYMKSDLVLMNEGIDSCCIITFFLNPGLRVDSVIEVGRALDFKREGQVLSVMRRMQPGDRVSLRLVYGGRIDDRVCYLDITDESYRSFKVFPEWLPYRFVRRYAYVGDEFTLLTPECLWYPVTAPPVIDTREKMMTNLYFTRYKLRVVGEKERMVVSQGKCRKEKGVYLFDAEHALPSISLCIGNYERRFLKDKGTIYEIYCFKGHDFFSGFFDSEVPVLRMIDFQKSMNLSLQDDKWSLERFMLVETPLSFFAYGRPGQVGSEFVQPEILFYPERGVELETFNVANEKKKFGKEPWFHETNFEMNVLNDIIGEGLCREVRSERVGSIIFSRMNAKFAMNVYTNNKRCCLPMLSTHVNFIKCDSFPVFNIVLRMMTREDDNNYDFSVFMPGGYSPAVSYLSSKSLSQAIRDTLLEYNVWIKIMKLKSLELKNYIRLHVSWDDFMEFYELFCKKTRYQNIMFNDFNRELGARFGVDLGGFMQNWYYANKLPVFSVKDIGVEKDVENGELYVSCRVWNRGEVDGVVSVNLRVARGGQVYTPSRRYLVRGGEHEEIRFKCSYPIEEGDASCSAEVLTNLSRNVPMNYEWKERLENLEFVRDTSIGRFPVDGVLGAFDRGEFVVDNRDKGFILREKGMSPLLLKNFKGTKDYLALYSGENVACWQPIAFKGFYGDSLRDAFYRSATEKGACAEWSILLPNSGWYEVFVYNTIEFAKSALIFASAGSELLQHYVVYHDEGECDFELNSGEAGDGWVSAGKYYFSAGVAKVVLTDRRVYPGQYIFADAVKWVPCSR